MERELLSIGELARASGLTVSALRFYDRARVLVPAWVDAHTGYRWYTADQVRAARLVAGLRRVGMPLVGITAAVGAEPAAVHGLLDAHLRRLEAGLADARRELSRIRTLLEPEETIVTTRLTLPRTALAAAFDAVRFAVGSDPDLPQLATVLVDVGADALTLVATDRYRLAVAGAPAAVTGEPVRVPVPVEAADRIRALLAPAAASSPPADARRAVDHTAAPVASSGDHAVSVGAVSAGPVSAGAGGDVTLVVDGAGVTVVVGDERVTFPGVDVDFPDHRRLLRGGGAAAPARRATVDVAALRATLGGAPTVQREHDGVRYEVTVLSVDDRGGLSVVGDDAGSGDDLRVGVNREFLLDALDAADRGQLVLELDGPITPLAVRRPDDESTWSLLMPIRL